MGSYLIGAFPMPARLRALFRFQESGLLLVILAIGALLTAFAGTVRSTLQPWPKAI